MHFLLQNLLQELKQRKKTLESISEKIQPISLVLNPTDNKSLGYLVRQLEQNSRSLQAIETGLQGLSRTPSNSGGSGRGQERGSGGKGSIFRSFYGGKKQDKVQDVKRNSELEESQVQDEPLFQDGEDSSDDDQDTPYARIDSLRKKILQGRDSSSSSSTLSPPNAGQTGRPLSISGQVFRLPPSEHAKPSSSLKAPELYERVEDAVPSPFLDYDMVGIASK